MRSVYLRNSYVQYTRYKNFKKLPSVLPNPNGFLSGRTVCRQKPLLQLIVKRRDRFTKTQGGTVRPWTWLEVHTLRSPQWMPLFLHRESILNSGAMVPRGGRCRNAKLWRRECYATCPHRSLFVQFSQKYFSQKRILPLIREIYSPRNISALQ